MATPGTGDYPRHLVDPPEVLQVTVIDGGGGWELRRRAAAVFGKLSRRVIAAVALAVAVAVAIGGPLAAMSHGSGGRRAAGPSGRSIGAAPASRGPAYRYPVGCLSVAIALHDPRFARAEFDRTRPCGPDGLYIAAGFHRAEIRRRRLHRVAIARCPVRSSPATLQDEQAVCP